MKDWFQKYYDQKPVLLLLILACIPRLISALFSKGYGMHDDHFLIIEASQSWIDGFDYNNWLPKNQTDPKPTGHSWFYVGLHYFFFQFLELIGISGPQLKMYIIRILHGAYSLLAIPPIFFIGRKLGGKQVGFNAALVFALLWFIPILSVRNLVELVSVPPMLWAVWMLYKRDDIKLKDVLLPAVFMGLAMAVRFHMSLFIGGIGLVLLFKRKVIPAAVFGLVVLLTLFVTQIGDLFLWGAPFVEMQEYVMYNLANKTTYFNEPWYKYLLTVGGLLLPPMGLAWLLGYFSQWKKAAIVFWPSLIFFAFHSYFPNKQERFILPIFPFVILFGELAFIELVNRKERFAGMRKWFLRIFWSLNILLLLVISPSYTKKSRVESMTILGNQKDLTGVVIEYTVENDAPMMPRFYLKQWGGVHYLTKKRPYDHPSNKLNEKALEDRPNYVVIFEPRELDSRIKSFEENYNAKLNHFETVDPSYMDALLHWLNPNNSNETAYIYRIEYRS